MYGFQHNEKPLKVNPYIPLCVGLKRHMTYPHRCFRFCWTACVYLLFFRGFCTSTIMSGSWIISVSDLLGRSGSPLCSFYGWMWQLPSPIRSAHILHQTEQRAASEKPHSSPGECMSIVCDGCKQLREGVHWKALGNGSQFSRPLWGMEDNGGPISLNNYHHCALAMSFKRNSNWGSSRGLHVSRRGWFI